MPDIGTEIAAIEKKIGVWLDPTHLVLTGLLVVALLTGVYFFESKRADVAEAKAEIAAQVLKAAQEAAVTAAQQNAILQQQSKETQTQMATANAQLQAANAQLQVANQQLSNALIKQKSDDAKLTPTAQAQRWAQLVPNAIVAATPTGFTIDPLGGLTTIQDLEELPADRKVITNLTAEVTHDNQTITNDATALSAEKTAHKSDVDNDQKQLMAANDATKKVQGDFNAYKAKTRKNFFKTVLVSIGVGLGIGAHFF
ncbi:MAG: hypothetical protein OK457_00620 [Thaumarchaeota archaeon]|nr:hypothetical protein [Nitrososphaerota archaeon]